MSENQVSTVLLLVALGLLIYYLSYSKCSSNEDFADATKVDATKVDATKVDAIKVDAIKVVDASPKPTTVPVTQVTVTQTEKPDLTIAAKITDAKLEDSVKVSTTNVVSKKQEPENDLFNYGANDLGATGASLDEAYLRPIPQEKRTDVIDINKNNVTKYDAKDFLPKEINDQWFDTDFSQAKHNINDDKLINTERYVIGVNTVGQSLKNASYDIRGTIPNPKFTVSPWNNSTYEPDFNLKPLC